MKLIPYLLTVALAVAVRAEDVKLSAVLNVRNVDNEHARPALDKTTKNKPMKIAGQEFTTGVGTEVNTRIAIELKGAQKFSARAGVDDASEGNSTVHFEVQADRQVLWQQDIKKGDAAVNVELNTAGRQQLLLITRDVGNAYSLALADWADASFQVNGARPETVPPASVEEPAEILTPAASPSPRINGARVFGVRPGNPFLYQIAATGERPMEFSADGLPSGLKLEANTGRITGVLAQAGAYPVTLHAKNDRGIATAMLRIVVGEEIALTPPMGWNSWNCWGTSVDQAKVLASARAMTSSGLINHGWSYVNIDDTWQGTRMGPNHALLSNEKFPDMKALCDEVHGMGLRVGIYSTPWETSYAGLAGGSADNLEGKWSSDLANEGGKKRRHEGKYSFADADAKQWAAWGMDYLKYDWNPKSTSPAETPAEFHHYVETMAKALRASGRDMEYSYSNSMPIEYIADVGPMFNAWRTTGDITDTWGRLRDIWFAQEKWRQYCRPGHWNDPDMLVVGLVDVGRGKNLHPSRLTPNEQYTHISLWCLLSAPLLIGCPIDRLDPFTLNLLTNDEVLELDQDELGQQAAETVVDGRKRIYVKELSDGSHAIGLFNLTDQPQEVSATWAQLKVSAPKRVRDLWRQKGLSADPEKISAIVPWHGVFLVRTWDK
jgi:alpha-galactosidase